MTQAFLIRTYYATKDYYLPRPVMQPLWESVKDPDGSVNFAMNYHRAYYDSNYDNPDDIYAMRWRGEDTPWNITSGDYNEVYIVELDEFSLTNQVTGDVITYKREERESVLDEYLDPHDFLQIDGLVS